MTKADLVEKVTRLGDLTRRDGEVIVETIFDSVIGALQGGDKIEIRGFGSFRIRQRNPRIGRNPKTGDRVKFPPSAFPISNRRKSCATWLTPKRPPRPRKRRPIFLPRNGRLILLPVVSRHVLLREGVRR